MIEYIPSIISALGTLLAAWFAYNQYTKNKLTDLKIEQWKKTEEENNVKKSYYIAQIYGVLWETLHELKSDRVYIIQPHPLVNNMYLSVGLEVGRNGITKMNNVVKSLVMSDIASFSGALSTREFMVYSSVSKDMRDKRARSVFLCNGANSLVIKKMSNDEHDWVGSLCADYMDDEKINPDFAKGVLDKAASEIQFILPEYK